MPQYDLGQERTSSSIISLKLLSLEDMYFVVLFLFFWWISLSSVNKPAAASPWGRQNSYLKLTCICDSFFFFVTKLRQKQLKAMATLFHANNTGWIKQKDVRGNRMYQVKAAAQSSQLFAPSSCLWKDTYAGISRMRALQTLAVCPGCPCFSIFTAIPGRSSFNLSYTGEIGKSILAAIFIPSLA